MSSLPERRRRQVLAAACELIAGRGFAAVRVADVAERAGVSTGTVHYYFEDKQTMLAAALAFAVDESIRRREPQLARLADPGERLLRLVELYLPVGEEELTWRIYVQLWGEALFRPELRQANAVYYGRWRSSIAAVVAEGQAGGSFAGGDPDDLASALVALLDGLAIQALLDPPRMPIDRMRALLRHHVERELLLGAGAAS